jgi:hypothetical protein
MKLITFTTPLDASLYSFLLPGCQEVKVTYSVLEVEGKVSFHDVEEIGARPKLMLLINNWPAVYDHAHKAALNNYHSLFVNP